jgi:uncharacterized membrane protein YqiK
MDLVTVSLVVGAGFIMLLGLGVTIARLYRQVAQGQVLIVNGTGGEPKVAFTGSLVFPVINRAEVMDISLKTVDIDRRGKEGLICADNIRADIKVTFFVRVNKTREDVLKVAGSVGCMRASDQATLRELFEAKFSEGLKTVGKRLNFESLYQERDSFKDQIVSVIGKDLNGYMLEDAAIDFLEQTPIEMLDKENILDSQGIRKITEMTANQAVLTNDFKQNERKLITKQNVEADEVVFNLERQRAEAAAKQKREIETMQARETAETIKVQSEEHMRSEIARLKAEEEILINDQGKHRQVEVAQKNRERVVGIETERVAKDRALEALNREREVELQRITKDKAIEIEKKAIADVVSSRIAVDKKVATEEELIKDLRTVAQAKREKDATVIHAEAEAMQHALGQTKAAEAAEEVARHQAKIQITQAEAGLEAAERQARAQIRLAEGAQAEAAADGLAKARVLEATAVASEKQGLANARVKEADAQATQKVGLAQAAITRERMSAEAAGDEQKGMAHAKVREAEAAASEKQGVAEASAIKAKVLAEATGIQEKLLAEARGLAEKAESMKMLQGATKEHEEFRLRLEKDKQVELEALHVRKDIAASNATVMANAMQHAKINIVGGDGQFFDQFMKAVTMGQQVDGAINNSESLQTFLKGYLSGDQNLPADLKEILSKPGLTQDAQNMAVASLLTRLAKDPAQLVEGLKAKK